MDPQATLRELLQAVLGGDHDGAHELAQVLDRWQRRGGFSPVEAVSSLYQGWKNYETWAVHLFLSGDEATDASCCRLAQGAVADASRCAAVQAGHWTIDFARQQLLVDRLKEFVDVRSPLADEASVFSDLLGSALCEVDWHEIADAFLERGLS